MSRTLSGLPATSVPLMCQTAACFGQTSTHAPHFMQDIRVSPRTMDSVVRDMVGQAFLQSTQGEQRVWSIFTSKTLVLLKIEMGIPLTQVAPTDCGLPLVFPEVG
jgi:hypothetical protein